MRTRCVLSSWRCAKLPTKLIFPAATVACELAEALGVAPQDSDSLLEERFGRSVGAEFAASGEAAFRAAEEELVCGLLARAGIHDCRGGGYRCSHRHTYRSSAIDAAAG